MANPLDLATRPLPKDPPILQGYAFVRVLGQGGMGAVYLFEDQQLRRPAAVKVIHPELLADGETHQRFLREARSLATVDHPNVVRVHAFFELEGTSCFVMEYVEGHTLSDLLKTLRPFPVSLALHIVRQTGEGLEAALGKGLVHRDIKPANLLIDRDRRVRIADLGLAKATQYGSEGEPLLTGRHTILGTPSYMPPEQARGEAVDHRGDIYSLGVVLFEMLAGERPYDGKNLGVLRAHPLPSIEGRREGLSLELVDLVAAMTAEARDERPASYADLRQLLDELPEGSSVEEVAFENPDTGLEVTHAITPRASGRKGSKTSDDPSLVRRLLSAVRLRPSLWWEIDQLLAVILMTPLWIYLGFSLDRWNPFGLGTLLFTGISLCQAVTTTLRAYMLLASAAVGSEEHASQVHRVTPWVRTVDLLLLVDVLGAGILLIRAEIHKTVGIFLAAVSIAAAVKFLLLDPYLLQRAFARPRSRTKTVH